ncbi:MAG: hypothetical protein M5U26_15275 [Planctomycetota bacterium]|nr:hypothetical protein [Planctomycetota bacterium]
MRRTLLPLMAAALILLAGCRRGDTGSSNIKPAEENQPQVAPAPAPAPRGPVVDGSVELRMRNPTGRTLVYEVRLDRTQEGNNRFTETAHFYLTSSCLDLTSEGLARIALARLYLDRSRKETLENGKTIDRIQPLTPELVNLGSNSDFVGGKRCYAFDAQNRIAYRTEDVVEMEDGTLLIGVLTKQDEASVTIETLDGPRMVARARIRRIYKIPTPHVLQFDTPHYFFPIFSSRPVAAGDRWAFKVPVIVPLEEPGVGRVLPTSFDVRLEASLRELRGGGDDQMATVDYAYEGKFDSSAEPFVGRFSQAFRDRNRVVHQLTGQGSAAVDVARGIVLEKTETFTILLAGSSLVPQPNNQPPKQEVRQDKLISRISLKLLPPGTVLRNGERVPPND